MGIFTPQSNLKVSYLLGLDRIHATCGNFLALLTEKLQVSNKKLIQWISVPNMPLQSIKTNSFWPQVVRNLDNIKL